METSTLDGNPRTGSTYSDYTTCPLLTIEAKLLFVLVYVKHAPTQVVFGSVFGMSQAAANLWIHRLPPILNQALKAAGA